MKDDNPTGRVSIWSVLAKYWNSIVWVLILFLVIWTSVFVTAYDFAEVANDSANTGSGPFKKGYYVAVSLAFIKDYASYTIGPVMIRAGDDSPRDHGVGDGRKGEFEDEI